MSQGSMPAEAGEILQLTLAMLSAANAGDFDDVKKQESERRRLLETLFSESAEGRMSGELLRDFIEEISAMDRKLMDLVKQERDQAAQELQKMRRQHHASRVYQGVEA